MSSQTGVSPVTQAPSTTRASATAFKVLAAISFCHLLNDMMQSVIPAVYPILKEKPSASISGRSDVITLTVQMTASLLQPFVGIYTDHRPTPYSLPVGMGFTLSGLLLLSIAPTFGMILLAVALVGVGSSVFHPESSRVARMASGGQHGLAQSLFQVGGNAGSSFLGPLFGGPRSASRRPTHDRLVFSGRTNRDGCTHARGRLVQRRRRDGRQGRGGSRRGPPSAALAAQVELGVALAVLMALVFSKYFYLASLTSYYTFFLMSRFHLPVRSAQIHLFIFLGAVAAGTFIGGSSGL